MKDPTPFDTVGDEPVETRIVAWVLGEASAFEAVELERLCEERPELLVFRRRMRALHGLLTEAEAAEEDHCWKLPPEKRKLLDEICGPEKRNFLEPARDQSIRRHGRRPLVAAAACVFLAFVVMRLIPKGYESEVKLQVQSMARGLSPLGRGMREKSAGPDDSQFFGTEFEKIRSRKSLEKVVENLDLESRWKVGKEEALQRLSQSISPERVKGTNLIRIRTRQPNEEDAREIAMEVAKCYQNYRKEIEFKQSEMALNEFNKAIRDQEDKVEERRKVLATIVRTEGIINKGQDSFYGQAEVDEKAMKDDTRKDVIRRGLDAQDYVDAKRDYENDLELLQAMRLKQTGQSVSSKAPVDSIAILDAPQSEAAPMIPASPPPAELASESKFKLSPARKSSSEIEESQLAMKREKLAASSKVAPPVVESEPVLPEIAESSGVEPMPTQSGALFAGAAGEGFELAGRSSWSQNEAGERAVADNLASGSSGSGGSASSNPLGKTVVKSMAVIPAPAESMFALEAKDSTEMPAKPWASGPGQPKLRAIPAKEKAVLGDSTQQTDSQLDVTLPPAMPSSLRALELSSDFQMDGDKSASLNLEMAKKRFGADGKSDGSGIGNEYAYRLRGESSQLPEDSVEAAKRQFESKESEGNEPLAEPEKEMVEVLRDFEEPSGGLKTEVTREFQYPTEYEPPAPATEPLTAEEAKMLPDVIREVSSAETPYSTFSLNIGDASFQVAKASLAKGERPDPSAIKIEQFYNAVDYGDPAPASNEPVAATIEQCAHPVIPGRSLVRVALRTGSTGRGAVQPLRLTLLVDQSGSMVREDRRAAMEHALSQLGVLLTKSDLVTVIGFSRTPRLLADGMTGDQAGKLGDLVNQTASEGGTNLEEAMKLAGQLAGRHQLAGAQNRIVLFTDGAANLGDANPGRLADQVKSLRQLGFAFDIAGIGADGLNDRLLGELARNGNGRYYVVGEEKSDSFASQLAGAFRPAAGNVKVQVNFNPQRVGKYKLIGFEKDRLKTEDFRNDAVDAAELAAEEAGIAIYQVETLPDGSGEVGEVSVRFRDAADQETVERTWTISHDPQAVAFDRATPSMQLAGLSLLAAEKLKGGPFADAIDFKQLAEPASLVKHFYGGSPRVADMLRVIDALK